MFRKYLIIAYRNLLKNNIFSIINILGLAIGMTVCVLIFNYVNYHLSFDRFFPGSQNIYRLVNIRYYPTKTDKSVGCVTALGPALKETFPEIENYTRCYKRGGAFTFNDKVFKERNIFFADKGFLNVFKIPVIKKITDSLLVMPNAAVVTEDFVSRVFGDVDPLGKTIMLDGNTPFVIEAVIKNIPTNCHFQTDVIFSLITAINSRNYCHDCNNRTTYIRLSENANASELESKLDRIIPKIHENTEFKREYKLQPLRKIHLHSNLRFEFEKNGSIRNIRLLISIAILILVIAWLNFINLSTSVIFSRIKEVAIRKISGAKRHQLIMQYMVESAFINIIAFALTITLVQLSLPVFQSIFNFKFSDTFMGIPQYWIYTFLLFMISIFITGIAPAKFISSFKLLDAFKNQVSHKTSSFKLRNIFVVTQFILALIMISTSIAAFKQNKFMFNHPLGMNISQVLVTSPHGVWVEGVDYGLRNETFVSEMMAFSNIEDVSFSSIVPGYESGEVSGGYYVEGQLESNSQQLYNYHVSQNFIKFYNISLICGENFSSEDKSDYIPSHDANTELMINLTACKKLGFSNPEEALGKSMMHGELPCGTIIGVVRDFHQQSLDKAIQPAYLRCFKQINHIAIKISDADIPKTLNFIKTKYNELYPGNPFDYYFLDEQFNQQYKEKIQTANLIGLFSIFAIFISCLGLLGLIIFDSRKKIKEIGIRKVNGANIYNIIVLFLKEKARLITIAIIIAFPISYFLVQKWLQNFAYKISLGWWFFILPIVIILIISALTVITFIIKTARANPSEALKYE